ncbi:MAG: T9SS type A sorting domain-containing protein [Chitinophagaceae bacterium]
MKKFYLAVACLLSCTAASFAQTNRYWIGTNGNWNDVNNWSATAGGSGGATVPNSTSFNAVFDKNAVVNVDIASFSLNRLSVGVTTTSAVRLYTSGNVVITLTSTSTSSRALEIATGSTLTDSAGVGNAAFQVVFANAAKGVINGTWAFSGVPGATSDPSDDGFAYFSMPGTTGQGNDLQVNGTISLNSDYTATPESPNGSGYITFNSGSFYILNCDGGGTPSANWNAASTVSVTGVETIVPVMNNSVGNTALVGNLIYNCAGMSADAQWNLPQDFLVQGNMSVLNTNNKVLSLALNSGLSDPIDYIVSGNLNISGSSALTFVNASPDVPYTLQVNGNFNLSGGIFSLRDYNGLGTPTNTVALKIKGNINHTGGTFTSNHPATSTANELYVVEMNGTSAQTITSSSAIDNAGHAVTLRINNSAGVTLTSPVTVGKISWNSTNKGNLNTTLINYLTINNPSNTDNTVVNGVSNAGYVSGPVARVTNAATAYRFPTGKSGVYRYAEVIPASTGASTYISEYFRTAYSNLTTNGTVDGVSNTQYWYINRVSGSNAAVKLTLQDGAVSNATPGSLITVAQYATISHWKNANNGVGTTLPAAATTGSVVSDDISNFLTGYFTFGYGNNSTLPIDLLDFSVKKQTTSSALLSWNISENSTPVKFGVLRSLDGVNFSAIGSVNAVDQKTDYSFTDNSLPTGNIYYRLQMYDQDGSYKLSKIIVLMNGAKGVLMTAMMPTIVQDRARLNVSSSEKGTLQLVVSDIQGRIVYQQLAGISNSSNQEVWMNLSSLSAGTYQVVGYMNDERVGTFRFIKQ